MAEKITREELDAIREWLPEGAKETIAEETGLTARSVGEILLDPKRFNKKVIKAALKLVGAEKQEVFEIKETIKTLV